VFSARRLPGGRVHDCLGSNVAAGARPALDDELLTEPLGQPLARHTREEVASTPGGEDDAHRFGLGSQAPTRIGASRER